MSSKITSFEQACTALGISSELPVVKALPEKHQKAIIAHYMIVIITQAINEGWEPNWNDQNEWRFFPWFEIKASSKKPSGFGFSGSDYSVASSGTDVGSRLCFKSRELALYAGKQFEELYQEYFLIQ